MSGYIGVEPVTQVTKVRTFGTLDSASTTIPVAGGFSPGNIEVYINGDYVLPTDYDESDGLNVVFGITLTAGTDYVVIEARQFLVADTWSKAEADTRYAEITGGADANFSVMPQVGGDPIVESGSNADGNFTKWADGTMVCFLIDPNSGKSTNINNAVGQLFVSTPKTWTHPVAFVGTKPAISGAARGGFSNGTNFIGQAGASLTTTGYYIVAALSGTNLAPPVALTAIGRWK